MKTSNRFPFFKDLCDTSKYVFVFIVSSVFYFTFLATLSAQDGTMSHFDTDDGLCGLVIYRAIQSTDGYMWFATDKGLCRYDGENFLEFESEVLHNNEILTVWECDNKIWFNNLLFQLFYIENGQINRFNPNGELNGIEVHDIMMDEKETYWIKGKHRVVRFVENNRNEFIAHTYTFSNVVKHVFPFESGEIGLISDSLYIFNENEKKFNGLTSLLNKKKFEHSKILNTDLINCAYVNPFLIRNNKVEFPLLDYQHLGLDVSSVILNAPDAYWIASSTGTYKVSKNFDAVVDFSEHLDNNRVNSVANDDKGNIWFCTNSEGIYIVQNQAIKNYTTKNSNLPSSFIYTIEADALGNFYIGTEDGWLSEFKNGDFINYKISDEHAELYSLLVEEDKILFACNGAYVVQKDDQGNLSKPKKFLNFPPKVMSRYNDDFWVATHDGIFRFSDENYEKISSLRSYSMEKGSEDQMWIGTPNGLYVYDYSIPFKYISSENQVKEFIADSATLMNSKLVYRNLNQQYSPSEIPEFVKIYNSAPFKKFTSVSNKKINDGIADIKQTSDGNTWVLTKRNGLYVIDKQRQLSVINRDNGLLSNAGNCLFVDENESVWVGTANGLNVFNSNLEQLKSFTTSNGLLSNNITSIYKSDSQVFVGTYKGLSIFDEKEMNPVEVNDIIFQKIQIQNRDTSIFNRYDLTYSQNNIFIDFVSISYDEKFSYQYMLAGRDLEWIDTEESFVRLSELANGSYTFKVKAISNNNTESKIASIHFKISPPFWKTSWFLALIACVCMLLLFLLVKYWVDQIKEKANKKSALERKFAQLELQALQAQMNPHFVFNSLNSIQNFILREDKVEASNYLSKFASLMRLFLESSRNKYINLKDELDLLKLYVDLERLRFQNKFDYNCEIESDVPTDVDIPSMLLQPFLENAINHGLANKKGKGKLNMKLSQVDNNIVCTIKDDGIGREKAQQLIKKRLNGHRSHGMKMINDRLAVLRLVDKYNVNIEIKDLYPDNPIDKGTIVKVTIPLDS